MLLMHRQVYCVGCRTIGMRERAVVGGEGRGAKFHADRLWRERYQRARHSHDHCNTNLTVSMSRVTMLIETTTNITTP